MVKSVFALVLALCFAAPVLAQEDYPRIETTFAYANLGMTVSDIFPGRHSGFSNISGLNLFPWLGIENYMGYYAMGSGVSLFSNTFGGRLTARNLGRVVPYIGAGIGVSYFSSGGSYSGSNFSTRVGGGVDIPINDSISWKFDVGRLSVKTGFLPGESWSSGVNVTTGITLNLGQ